MALPERGMPASVAAQPKDAWTDPEFTSEYPSIFSFLYDPTYASGKLRLTGGFSFFTKLGTLTCSVNDNDRKLVAYVTATTWVELLFKLEEGIGADTLDWKAKVPFTPNKSGNGANVPPF